MKDIAWIVFIILLCCSSVFAGPIDLPRDSNGWTIFSPSSDTRIIYVAADGNNSTAQNYTSVSAEVGSDPFNPSGLILPYATFTAAFAQARAGYPDWILFKRGDSFTITEQYGMSPRNGRSATEPSLIGSYGATGASPILKYPATNEIAVDLEGATKVWVAIAGLDFYSSTRDPGSGDYAGTAAHTQAAIYGYSGSTTVPYGGFLIEGCKFRFFDDSIINTAIPVEGLVFRRNIFSDNYAGSGQGHSQGLFVSKQNLTLEENIFIHNGWRDPSGGSIGAATIFNHNVYNESPAGATYTGNIFIQGSNMNNKFTAGSSTNAAPIVIENNLYIDGQQGVGFGNNTAGYSPFNNVTIQDNVFTNIGRSDHLQSIAWGVDLGFDTTNTLISHNLLLNQDNTNVTNCFSFGIAGGQSTVSVSNNTVYNFKFANGLVVSSLGQLGSSSTKTNVVFSNNKLQTAVNSGYFEYLNYTTMTGISLSGNIYYGDRSASDLFYNLGTTTAYSLSGWQSLTGDTSTIEQVSFSDPTRDVDTYMESIGETATLDAFVAAVRAQDRYSWDARLMAQPVNAYIKCGFAPAGHAALNGAGHAALNGVGSLTIQ